MNWSRTTRLLLEKFFTQPSHEALQEVLLGSFGELNAFDCKREWIEYPTLAKHMLGMANSGGGIIIIGVEQKGGTFTAVGLSDVRDPVDVSNVISRFMPSTLRYEIIPFDFSDSKGSSLSGRKFQVIFIDDTPEHLPFRSLEGSDRKIRESVIYVRRGTGTVEARQDELYELATRRLQSGRRGRGAVSLQQDLDQLRVLYQQLPPGYQPVDEVRERDYYDDEDFYMFVFHLRDAKENLISFALLDNR